jgi:hypothetical protein
MWDSVRLENIQVIRDMGPTWLCMIGGKAVAMPPRLLMAGSTVGWPRARHGTAVIPRSLAISLGLVASG